jgi:hypothetical protein
VLEEDELRELEDEQTWDFDSATIHPPSKSARAIVPVAFGPGDFEQVAEYARRKGLKLSEFIRQAVLDQIAAERAATRSPASS